MKKLKLDASEKQIYLFFRTYDLDEDGYIT